MVCGLAGQGDDSICKMTVGGIMNPKPKKILLILLILTVCFIWGNSMMPASVSSALSTWVQSVVNGFLGGVAEESTEVGHGTLRKIAHLLEFATFGALYGGFLRWDLKKKWWAVLLGGIGVAFIDETIQLFSDGRGAQVSDIWIDLGGFFIGLFLSAVVYHLVKRWKRIG